MGHPLAIDQPVRVVRVPHDCLHGDLGRIEIVTGRLGGWVWCQPAACLNDGALCRDPNRPYWIARPIEDVEAYVCA